MDPLTVSIVIDAPQEQVFDYLADIANHSQFTDHYLVDWRLTRDRSVGLGAGARYRVKAPASRFSWGDSTFAELERPRRIIEVGRTGKGNRIRSIGTYELSAGAHGQGTKVSFTIETQPRMLSDRIMEALGRGWLKRQNAKALRRLRSIIERGEGAGERVTVAGG